jgi:hypothetical protein
MRQSPSAARIQRSLSQAASVDEKSVYYTPRRSAAGIVRNSLWNAVRNGRLLFPMKRTPEEVANTIEGFVNGTDNQWAWDGFTSIRLDDPELEAIRQKVVSLPVEFPPSNPRAYCSEAGLDRMRQIVRDLRERNRRDIEIGK